MTGDEETLMNRRELNKMKKLKKRKTSRIQTPPPTPFSKRSKSHAQTYYSYESVVRCMQLRGGGDALLWTSGKPGKLLLSTRVADIQSGLAPPPCWGTGGVEPSRWNPREFLNLSHRFSVFAINKYGLSQFHFRRCAKPPLLKTVFSGGI